MSLVLQPGQENECLPNAGGWVDVPAVCLPATSPFWMFCRAAGENLMTSPNSKLRLRRQGRAAEGCQDTSRTYEGLTRVHGQEIVDDQDVTLLPLERHALLTHEFSYIFNGLVIDRSEVTQHDSILADIS